MRKRKTATTELNSYRVNYQKYKYFRVEMHRIQAFLLLQGSQVIQDLQFLDKLTFSQEMDIVLNTQV